MKRTLFLLALMSAAPLALDAQGIVIPSSRLDGSRVRARDALLVLRDSLMTISGAAASLQRDFRRTSGAVLSARARELSSACARSARTIDPARAGCRAARQHHAIGDAAVGALARLAEHGAGPLRHRIQSDVRAGQGRGSPGLWHPALGADSQGARGLRPCHCGVFCQLGHRRAATGRSSGSPGGLSRRWGIVDSHSHKLWTERRK